MKTLQLIIAILIVTSPAFIQGQYVDIPASNLLVESMTKTNRCLDKTIYTGIQDSGRILITTNHVDSVEYMIENGTLTNVIKQLAEEGHICDVLGHRYKSGEYLEQHKCAICGKIETKISPNNSPAGREDENGNNGHSKKHTR